jgi:serine/threonine protein kinase
MPLLKTNVAMAVHEQRWRPSWAKIIRLGAEIAAGVAHLHSLGLVHRDLKPANLLLDDDGTCKVKIQGTFGLSQGTFGLIQGTFGLTQGKFGLNKKLFKNYAFVHVAWLPRVVRSLKARLRLRNRVQLDQGFQ